MTDDNRTPPRPAAYEAGFDEEDPYENEDLDAYPEWWRRNVRTFRAHGMRPYRPPTFADGTVVPEVVETLEDELDVGVVIRYLVSEDHWEIVVDGEPVTTVDRYRNEEGRSVYYAMNADEFRAVVRDAVD